MNLTTAQIGQRSTRRRHGLPVAQDDVHLGQDPSVTPAPEVDDRSNPQQYPFAGLSPARARCAGNGESDVAVMQTRQWHPLLP